MIKKGKDIADELEGIAPGFNLPPAPPPYSVPDGYFNALPEQVMQRIRSLEADPVQEELETLSPLLADARGTSPRQPLSTPKGYFNDLSEKIMAGINQYQETPAKVVPMQSRRRYLSWAVAACLIGLIGVSAVFLLRQNAGNGNNIATQLAGVSDQEIVEYLQAHSDAFDNDAIFSNVSNVEVAEELPRISTSLNDLPAEAIEKYLENSGWSN